MTCVRIGGLIGLLCATLTFGQAARQGSAPDSFEPQTLPAIRIDVDLVLLNATVTDSGNKFVTGLKQEDFRVWEDKIEQRVEYFSAENVPVSVGIIFDVSGSMATKLTAASAAASTFLNMGDPDDEYFLIQFSDSPRVVQDFTTDITKLQSRLLFSRAKGSTSLYDAMYLGLEKLNGGANSRKALLLITDGEDNHSRYSLSDLKEIAREHDVMIYSIGLVEGSGLQFGYGMPIYGFDGRTTLQGLSELTGGVAYFPDSLGVLPDICEQIGRDLKNQYVLGYRPSNVSRDGKWRKLRVKVSSQRGMPSLRVRAKSGYYASALAKVMK
jgi:Ca-activated chloride channel family protein